VADRPTTDHATPSVAKKAPHTTSAVVRPMQPKMCIGLILVTTVTRVSCR